MLSPTADSLLILFPGALGDCLCFFPTLCGLRALHRGRMLFVAQDGFLKLIHLPGLTTASIHRREVAGLFGATTLSFDTTRLFEGFAQTYSWTGFGDANFAERVALATGGAVDVFQFRGMRPGEHAADYYARCVGLSVASIDGGALVEDATWLDEFCHRYDVTTHVQLVIHPGSGSAPKNWQGFDVVARHWQTHYGGPVVWLQGPAENERPAPHDLECVLASDLSLPQVVALLRRSTLYLGNDSGISHLAGAVGARGVVLFGPSDPAAWAPRSPALRIVHTPEACACCGPDAFCVHRLSAEAVIAALDGERC